MRGLDYHWLAALDAVVAHGGFDKGAQALFVTQSAISQRIKQLERWLAQPVLVRATPPRPTELGQRLLGHYRRVQLLEQELHPALSPEGSGPLSLAIATNADSLATWLLPALTPLMRSGQLLLNLMVDDESRTLNRLRSGEAVAAISSEPTPMAGCVSDSLGRLDYLCVASPAFASHYFADGIDAGALARAPAVVFDPHDDMHGVFLAERFALSSVAWPHHVVRSSEAFVKLALQGCAYCLIPRLMIEPELASGELVDLLPGQGVSRTLYWHRWALESGLLARLSEICIGRARTVLAQSEQV
ncbi:LysR family transcriptional regulator ArgP [Aeromonas schubertii]|uniref:LysR family transcriptional regulator ArgP n=2 Tax=Aeromonas TaxID=642 RepID=UPI001CC719BC|nr:LysR family transcriptional regulator ArgP [Aeromonas schubertii]MBZ6074244.1 LysR family transcriptional regulator ArgP [Aeromonas schubertii]